jgi:predicted nucleotidyltransferase
LQSFSRFSRLLESQIPLSVLAIANHGELEDIWVISYIWVMLTKNDILSRLKELKCVLQIEYAVKEIGLFGSFSDNTFDDESDIDIIVEFERPIGWKFFSVEMYLESVFKRKIDLVSKNALKEQIRGSVLSQVSYA